jgi:low temperature requirement protein LtrA
LAAVGYDFASVFVTATISKGWVIQSAAHFAERHGLIVILALGESILAIATGSGAARLTVRLVLGAILSILIAGGLYFAYFARVDEQLERALDAVRGRERATLGTAVFTYLHFPIIVGVIVTALSIERSMSRLDEPRLGTLGGWALGVGVALYLAGTVAVVRRSGGGWSGPRSVACVVMACASPGSPCRPRWWPRASPRWRCCSCPWSTPAGFRRGVGVTTDFVDTPMAVGWRHAVDRRSTC